MDYQSWIRGGLALMLLLSANCAIAHPFHTSSAEAHWNESSQTLEVSLRVYPLDLEQVLQARTGKTINLDVTPGVDKLIQAYLSDRFQLLSADGKSLPFRWVGKEVEVKESWLHFEFPIADGPFDVRYRNRVFFDHLPDQINTIEFRIGGNRQSLRFTADKSVQTLKEDE